MLDVTRDGRVAIVTMDHGPVNAMDLELLQALAATIRELDLEEGVRAIVLTGGGRAFCAGVDLQRLLDSDLGHTREFLAALTDAFVAPVESTTPVIAAVNGHAIAGGAILAAACHYVVLTDDARTRIGLTELAVGVPFPTAAIEIMRRRLGVCLGPAMLLADLYSPADACSRGFVDEVVPAADVVTRATAVARALTLVPATTAALSVEQLMATVRGALAHDSDWDRMVTEAWCSDEIRTAIRAFVDATL